MKTILVLILLLVTHSVAEARPSPRKYLRTKVDTDDGGGSTRLKSSDLLVGARAGGLGAFEGALSVGANLEYMISSEIGVSGQLMHAGYSTSLSAGPMSAEINSSAFVVAAMANYHPDFIHVKSLDPFAALGLAHSFVKTEASVGGAGFPAGSVPEGISVDGDSTFLVASVGARYFFDPHFSAVGTLGIGLSALSVGVDYLF